MFGTYGIIVLMAIVALIAVTSVKTSCANAIPPQSRIVGGASTHITNFPHEVSVRRKSCDVCAYEHYCGGAIYTANVIITAANCVRSVEAIHTQIVAGTSYRQGAAHDGMVFPVSKITVHEDISIDIAILHLALPIPLNSLTTATVNMAAEAPKAGQIAIVAGWGQLEESGAYSEFLQAVQVPIIEHEACKLSYPWSNVTDHEICAGYSKGGSDACQGDAGSALLVEQKMVGIVSWGYGCARPNKPGVYTNVVSLRDWIATNA